ENSRSHFAQPGAAFSQVLRSSDFAESEIMVATSLVRVFTLPLMSAGAETMSKEALAGIVVPSGMSALGQKQTSRHLQPMSALPPKADIETQSRDVRFVPKADIRTTQGDSSDP